MGRILVVLVQMKAGRAYGWRGEQVKAGAFTSVLPLDIHPPDNHVSINLISAIHTLRYVYFSASDAYLLQS